MIDPRGGGQTQETTYVIRGDFARPKGRSEYEVVRARSEAAGAQRVTQSARRRILVEGAFDPGTLSQRLRAIGVPGEVSNVRMISYQPGARALVAYDLSNGDSSRQVYGKLYSEPIRAARLYGTLTALLAESSARRLPFRVPRPVAWLRDLNLVLFTPLRGRFLDDLMVEGDSTQIRRTGRSLAQLHTCHPPLDRSFNLTTEMTNLRRWAGIVAEQCQDDGGSAPELVSALEESATSLQLDDNVPIHKDFHPHHVILGNELGIIDLDEMRWGDRTFDLAHFCVYLRLLGMKLEAPAKWADALERAFLEGYAPPNGRAADQRSAFFGIYACLKVGRQLCEMNGARPIPVGAERGRVLREILAHGRSLVRKVV
jgi:hypothetical protein